MHIHRHYTNEKLIFYNERRLHDAMPNVLYEGPSYVSIESALSYYGLIPERTMVRKIQFA